MEFFFVQFTEKVKAVIQSSASFASIGCVRDVVVLGIGRNSMVSLNVGLLQVGNRRIKEVSGDVIKWSIS